MTGNSPKARHPAPAQARAGRYSSSYCRSWQVAGGCAGTEDSCWLQTSLGFSQGSPLPIQISSHSIPSRAIPIPPQSHPIPISPHPDLIPLHPIPICPNPSQSHPNPIPSQSHLIPLHPTPSHSIPLHPIPGLSHPVPSHPTPPGQPWTIPLRVRSVSLRCESLAACAQGASSPPWLVTQRSH